MKKALTIILFVLISLLVQCLYKAQAQAISVGTGKTSSGRTAAIITAESKKHVLYLKSIQQDVWESKSYPGETEQHETTLGYGYKSDKRVTLLIGVGWCKDYTSTPNQLGTLYLSPGLRMSSFEYGFRYDLFNYRRFDISITALMSTYSGLSTMAGIKWKFENCR